MTCCRAVAPGLFSARATPLRVRLSATRHGGLQARRVPCVVCGALAKEAPYIKVCGVMSAADAQHAAEAGANLIGMIMFPRAKRALTVEQAKRVAEVARAHGAEPVGVFVDEDAETIVRTAREADLKIVQLHGPASQASLASIPADVGVVFVVTITPDGSLSTPIPDPLPRPVDLFIIDAAKVPGESLKLDWSALPPRGLPAGAAWLLAGGLTADNVREAVRTAVPTGVDVSSGVCQPDGLAKDPVKVKYFVERAASGLGLTQSSLHA